MIHRLRTHIWRQWHIWVCAALSYVPLFLSHHGRLNADTKLYLGEDPAGLISRSWFAWDSSQFGGFIPHQAIAYLWPSGPFYLFFDVIGVPQWITQRLWLGTLFFIAAAGVYAFVRWMPFSQSAALLAALVFLFSPYVLAYQSRTSSMLLPWAGLGWLCYFTARGIRSRSWLWPALIAFTMFTIGSVNATATLMILPAPFLVALHFLPATSPARSFLTFSIRTTLLTTGTSLWWIAMLYIQGQYGADLLSYSETLESVSSTSHAFEVLRGFGYWLNYVDLNTLPLTTAARDIFSSPSALLATTLIPLFALIALAIIRNAHRRLGLWLILVGVVLAVGVYPLDNPTPLFEPLASRPTSSLSLAFRSSTRAIPLIILGIAIGCAMLVDSSLWRNIAFRRAERRTRILTPGQFALWGITAVLLVASFPTKFTDGAFEQSLQRSPIPNTWKNLASSLANNESPGARIVQVPGQEFGAYTWGYTVDPALPAVTDTGVLTRDLIPLGNETTMDTLWALDDAIREGRLHPDALTSLGRILSFNTMFFPSDLDLKRYNTPSQQDVIAANGVSSVSQTSTSTGDHAIISLGSPTGALIRQYPTTALLLGNGKGIVDSAIAGVVENDAIVLAGHLSDSQLQELAQRPQRVIVTDTNTERAQHWRTSVDTTGFDEDRAGELTNFARDTGDIRMRVFQQQRSDDHTWFEQIGPVRARASSYGPPLTYRPEYRPFAAIDDNPATAWQVAHGVEPLAPVLEIRAESPVQSLRLLQPTNSPNRVISTISIALDGGPWTRAELTDESLSQGQAIVLDAPATTISLRIDTVRTIRTPQPNEELSGVGFAEVATGLEPTHEIGVLPTRGLEEISSTTPLAYVLTRRVAPLFRDDRSDIETTWARSLTVPSARTFVIRARVDATSFTEQQRTEALTELNRGPTVLMDDTTIPLVFVYDEQQQAFIGESNSIALESGEHIINTVSSSIPIDQIILQSTEMSPTEPLVTYPQFNGGLVKKTVTLAPCPTGCWVVFGEGHSLGWSATVYNTQLGESTPIDGGANGWWLAPFADEEKLTIEFSPQKTLTTALILSALVLVLVLFLMMRYRTDTRAVLNDSSPTTFVLRPSVRQKILSLIFVAIVCASLFSGATTLTAVVILALATTFRRLHLINIIALIVLIGAMLSSWWTLVSVDPSLNFDWANTSSASHHTLLISLTVLACASLLQHNDEPTIPLHTNNSTPHD